MLTADAEFDVRTYLTALFSSLRRISVQYAQYRCDGTICLNFEFEPAKFSLYPAYGIRPELLGPADQFIRGIGSVEIGPLSGDVCLKGGFLPLPYGTPVFSDELLLIIDPDLLIRCLN